MFVICSTLFVVRFFMLIKCYIFQEILLNVCNLFNWFAVRFFMLIKCYIFQEILVNVCNLFHRFLFAFMLIKCYIFQDTCFSF